MEGIIIGVVIYIAIVTFIKVKESAGLAMGFAIVIAVASALLFFQYPLFSGFHPVILYMASGLLMGITYYLMIPGIGLAEMSAGMKFGIFFGCVVAWPLIIFSFSKCIAEDLAM